MDDMADEIRNRKENSKTGNNVKQWGINQNVDHE